MSETKEFTERVQRKVVKINVILEYGIENALIIKEALKSNNTQEKLQHIPNILKCTITDEQKLFVIQKLLAYPKSVRFSIASQIKARIDSELLRNQEVKGDS